MEDLTPAQRRVMGAVLGQRIGIHSDELLDHTGMHARQQGGVVASLVAKGLLNTERDGRRTFVSATAHGEICSQ